MLYAIILATTILTFVSGVAALRAGDWHSLGLKYAGLSLSTVATLFFLTTMIVYPEMNNFPSDAAKLDYVCYSIIRNISLIIFHLAVARDASAIQCGDRRTSTDHHRHAA